MIEYKLKNNNVLKDGHTMFKKDIVKELNRKAYLEDLKSKTDGGATVPCSDGLVPPVNAMENVETFICWMIDNCEREIVTEELLQLWYAKFLDWHKEHKPEWY